MLRFAAFLLIPWLCGCRTSPATTSTPPDAADVPHLAFSVAPAPEILNDPLWKEALEGDPIDLAALADQEGTSGLLEAVERGGQTGRTALNALPYAENSLQACPRLCEIAARSGEDTQVAALEITHAILLGSPLATSPENEEGLAECRTHLSAVVNNKLTSPKARGLAASTLGLLVSRQGSVVPEAPSPL